MLNEGKIRLMTRAAIYETHEGKKTIPVNQYFKGDYISINMIWGALGYTLAYVLCLGLWAFYKLEFLMENIHKMDLPAFGKRLLIIYVIGLLVYLVILLIFYSRKYKMSRRSLGRYYQILKRISAIYDAEERELGSKHTPGGTKNDDDAT